MDTFLDQDDCAIAVFVCVYEAKHRAPADMFPLQTFLVMYHYTQLPAIKLNFNSSLQ